MHLVEPGHATTTIPWERYCRLRDAQAEPDGVRIRTRDGIRFVRIAGVYGADGKFRDAFKLAMILRSLLGR